ncbi:MAG: hypothetical protein KAT43_05495 [Nanoarchaeota archaeon]|nr:hypothetical protein [Nanoarchaeota archaeon]
MAMKGRVRNLSFGRGRIGGAKTSKRITGTLKRIGGGGQLEFEAPPSMVDKLSVNSIVEFTPVKGKLKKWDQRRVKITKIIS